MTELRLKMKDTEYFLLRTDNISPQICWRTETAQYLELSRVKCLLKYAQSANILGCFCQLGIEEGDFGQVDQWLNQVCLR